jgi:hypothetical protein
MDMSKVDIPAELMETAISTLAENPWGNKETYMASIKTDLRKQEIKKLYEWLVLQQNIDPPPMGTGNDFTIKGVSLQLKKGLKNRVLCNKLKKMGIYDLYFESISGNREIGIPADKDLNLTWNFTAIFNDRFFTHSSVSKQEVLDSWPVQDVLNKEVSRFDVLDYALKEMVIAHQNHLLTESEKRAKEMEAMDYSELENKTAEVIRQASDVPAKEVPLTREERKLAKKHAAKEAKKRMKEAMANGTLAEQAKADLQRKIIMKRQRELQALQEKQQPQITEEQAKQYLQQRGLIPMTV